MSAEALGRSRLAEIPAHTLARLALRVDAVITGANGVAYLALADLLDSPLAIEASAMRAVGAFLALFAVGVWVAGSAPTIRRPALLTVAAANAAWVVASAAAALADWLTPSVGGTVWIVAQALTVAGFAAFQLTAAGRLSREP